MTTVGEATTGRDRKAAKPAPRIVDTDVHERAALSDLLPFLEPVWRKYITRVRLGAGSLPSVLAADRWRLGPGGLKDARWWTWWDRMSASCDQQLLDEYSVEARDPHRMAERFSLPGGDGQSSKPRLTSAYNDWQVENWLDQGTLDYTALST